MHTSSVTFSVAALSRSIFLCNFKFLLILIHRHLNFLFNVKSFCPLNFDQIMSVTKKKCHFPFLIILPSEYENSNLIVLQYIIYNSATCARSGSGEHEKPSVAL